MSVIALTACRAPSTNDGGNPAPVGGVGGTMNGPGGMMASQGGSAGTTTTGGAGGVTSAGAAGMGMAGNHVTGGSPSTGGGGSGGGSAGGAGEGGNAGTGNAGTGNAGAGNAGAGNGGTGGVEIINTPGACEETWGNQGNGSITFYTFNQGTADVGDVHCSFGIHQDPDRVNHVHTGNGEFFGAMNTADYSAAAACGACVELRRDDGRSVQVTIVDECPIGSNDKCVSGHIDLSRAAFLQLAQESEGYVGQRAGLGSISWNYIPCPTEGNVQIRFVEPQNEFYDGIVVENHRYPIESVDVWEEGRWVECQREAYNFWFTGDTDFSDDPPFYFRVTDINGGVFTVQAPEAPGSQDTGQTQMCR